MKYVLHFLKYDSKIDKSIKSHNAKLGLVA